MSVSPPETISEQEMRRLEELLRAAGSPLDAHGALELLRGIAAAPDTGTAGNAELWTGLFADSPTAVLRDELVRLKPLFASAKEPTSATGERTSLLREELRRRGLDGFIVPRADEHQGEYVPASAARLQWLTGFSGSAGLAIVLPDAAAIFVDGRYTLQVRNQVPSELYQPNQIPDEPPGRWIEKHLGPGMKLGYDPWLHTETETKRFAEACAKAGGELVPCDANPVDTIWADRPPPPLAPVVPHDMRHAGESSADKRRRLAEELASAAVDAAVISAPDSIAWLLNVRGGDVEHTPLPLSFALLHADARVSWFVDPRKVHPSTLRHLGYGVGIEPPLRLDGALEALARDRATVQADPGAAPAAILQKLEAGGAKLVRKPDPCMLPKARKNPVELQGARDAHERDAVAIARFLAWLAREAPRGTVSEIEAADRLLAFRRELPLFRDLSFATISGAGPNGAIVHYRVTEATNRRLEPGNLYLVDSGAQFLDGTTDITRTVAIGEPTAEMRERFTRVLKGHIALSTARFPRGTTGSQLDALARLALWQAGLDFDHGTGHGVGSYLSVHEGPQRISKVGNSTALEPGMILSNEPGYYKTGAYGIRTENLIVVRPAALTDAERETFEFEILTLAPIDRALIEIEMLTQEERRWLDEYHRRVRETVAPHLEEDDRTWLVAATTPVA